MAKKTNDNQTIGVTSHNLSNDNSLQKDSPITQTDYILLEGCESGNLDLVYENIWKKANINCKKPIYGSSPLGIACRQGHASIAKVLLEFGANPTSKDSYGVTPLHWAANSGKPQVIKCLTDRGKIPYADLNRKDCYGSTALHFACIRNHTNSVDILIEIGCDPFISNNDGCKPIDLTTNESIKSFLRDVQEKMGTPTGKRAAKIPNYVKTPIKSKRSESLVAEKIVTKGTPKDQIKSRKTIEVNAKSNGKKTIALKGFIPARK